MPGGLQHWAPADLCSPAWTCVVWGRPAQPGARATAGGSALHVATGAAPTPGAWGGSALSPGARGASGLGPGSAKGGSELSEQRAPTCRAELCTAGVSRASAPRYCLACLPSFWGAAPRTPPGLGLLLRYSGGVRSIEAAAVRRPRPLSFPTSKFPELPAPAPPPGGGRRGD
jgi:hypothetical protein